MTRRTATRSTATRKGLWAALFALLLVFSLVAVQNRALAVPAPAVSDDYAVTPSQDTAADGEALFASTCTACHTIGGGDGVGPDLEGVTARRDAAWLASWLANPPQLIADGDPIATEMLAAFNGLEMPSFGLSEAQIDSLIAYFDSQGGGDAAPTTPAPATATGEGDSDAGKNIFTGVTRLENGGPSCRACHSSGGIGGLGGGKLGPDLTGAYAKLGDAMILWPETSQTMKPIFSEKPLTDSEKADLLAFFSSTDVTKRSTEVIGQLVGLAVVGIVVIGVLIQLIWRRRLAGVRIPMVEDQRNDG